MNQPLCLELAINELRRARLLLETATQSKDLSVNLRRQLEYSFDNYLNMKTTESRLEFINVVAVIDSSMLKNED